MMIMLVYQSKPEVFKKKEWLHKLPFVIFKITYGRSVRGKEWNTVKIDGVAQMVVVLTHEEMSHLVVVLFDDLVGTLLY